MTYCYFGHHKCASAWFCGVIPVVCQDLGLSWHTTSSFADFDFGSPAGRADFLLFRNAGMNHVPRERDFRVSTSSAIRGTWSCPHTIRTGGAIRRRRSGRS